MPVIIGGLKDPNDRRRIQLTLDRDGLVVVNLPDLHNKWLVRFLPFIYKTRMPFRFPPAPYGIHPLRECLEQLGYEVAEGVLEGSMPFAPFTPKARAIIKEEGAIMEINLPPARRSSLRPRERSATSLGIRRNDGDPDFRPGDSIRHCPRLETGRLHRLSAPAGVV